MRAQIERRPHEQRVFAAAQPAYVGRLMARWMLVAGMLVAVLPGLSCAADKRVAPPPEPTPEKAPKASARVEQTTGAMNDHDVDRAFRKFEKKVGRCVADGARRIEGIGGQVRLDLRIDTEGRVQSAHLSQSTLGDRETERCILDGALARTWPKAKGGIGEASHEFSIEPSVPVTQWQSKRLRPVMSEIHKKVAKCVMPLEGKQWSATIYIRQNGRVAASGVAQPTVEDDDRAECLAKALNRFRFGPQRSKLTKVSFTIP